MKTIVVFSLFWQSDFGPSDNVEWLQCQRAIKVPLSILSEWNFPSDFIESPHGAKKGERDFTVVWDLDIARTGIQQLLLNAARVYCES